jgi:hypothetical protein
MNFRTTEISQMLLRWLDRYSPPASMKDKPQAMQDEAEALLRVLLKFAPASDYVGWVNGALDSLEYQMKTRAWPTKGEMGAVCANLRKDKAVNAEPVVFDTYSIMAAKMKAGGAVGEAYLYGREACEIIKRRLVTEETMKAYRSAAFLNRSQMYGEDAALKWEAQAKHDHEMAKAMLRDAETQKRAVALPAMKPVRAYSEAAE